MTRSERPRRMTTIAVLIGASLGFTALSLSLLVISAAPHITSGTVPPDPYYRNYARFPWQAALHIVPGALYLGIALFQLNPGFRRKHLGLHRRLGRVAVASGIFAAIYAIEIGMTHPFDGLAEGSAAVVFAAWLVVCLVIAFAAVRRRDIATHRRWMIRAFAVAVGIGTVRLWAEILNVAFLPFANGMPELVPQRGTFGIAFWLGFGVNVLLGEWWLRRPVRRA